MLITSKGNGRNYYGWEEGKSSPIEVIKVKGRYYAAKYVLGEELMAVGEPLKDFTLLED